MSHIYHGDLGPPPQYEELYSSVPAPASSQNTYAPPPVASQRQQGTQPLARKQFSSAEDRRLLDEYVPLYKGYVEEGHSVYHWEIDDWTGLPSVACSPAFMAAGQEFQIIVHRNDGYAGSHVSLYLMCMPTETDGSVPHLCAYFSLVMSNFADPLSNQKQAFEVRFTPQQIQMGQTEFTNQSRLHTAQYQHSRPIIENNCVRISAYVRVIEDEAGTLWEDVDKADVYPSADPVGSAGTADYPFLNSLLQTYYHMRMLRNDIYAVPTFNKDAKSSIVRAAQEIFQALEVGDGKPISHQILVEVLRNNSIGAVPATHTRDLCGAVRREIADATLDTVAEGMARRLFSGQIRRTVAYPDIPFSETRVDEYFDLALQIEDGGSLSSALDEYCKTKQMRPEDIPGLQPGEQVNALQSICFESFPPVLHIHLNRFKLDHVKRKVVGNPNRFEYPETIDLSEFMPNDAGARKTWTYSLYAVYYYTVRGAGRPVFVSNIAAGPPGKWLWVGEHTVVPIRKYDVLSLDHEPDPVPIARGEPLVPFNKADRVCMLMYIRDDLRDIVINSNESWRLNQALRARSTLMTSLGDADDNIPLAKLQLNDRPLSEVSAADTQSLATVVSQTSSNGPEAKAEETMDSGVLTDPVAEEQQKPQMISVRIIGRAHFQTHQGFDLYNFDCPPSPPAKQPLEMELPPNYLLSDLRQLYAMCMHVNKASMRLWFLVQRPNGTIRCNHTIESRTEKTLGEVVDMYSRDPHLARFYCEVGEIRTPRAFLSFTEPADLCAICIKFYNRQLDRIVGLGLLYVDLEKKIKSAFSIVRKMAKVDLGASFVVYEEVGPGKVNRLDPERTFMFSQILVGDVLCFELKSNTSGPGQIPERSALGFYARRAKELGLDLNDRAEGSIF